MPITPGGRVSPNAGDDFDLVTDLAAMQVSNEAATNAAIAAIDLPQNYRIGPNSDRLALSGADLFEGLKFYTTDTNRDWFYDGTNWLPADPAKYLIRPTSVSGGSIGTDGTINLSSAGTVVQVNGVFSSRFRRYEVAGNLLSPTNSYLAVQMSNSGTPVGTSSYAYQDGTLNGSGNTAAFSATYGNFPVGRNLGQEHFFQIEFSSPGIAARTMISGDDTAYLAGKTIGGGYMNTSTAYDGFALLAPGTTSISGGNISIYGLV